MNNSGSLIKILSGISKSLRIADQVIPIYKDSVPLIKNIKSFFYKNKSNNIKNNNNEEKKVIITNDNNPKFFI